MVIKAHAVSDCVPITSKHIIAVTSVPLSRNHACLQAVLLSRLQWGGDDSVCVHSGWGGVRGREGSVGPVVVQDQTELVISQAAARVCTVHRYSPTATGTNTL